MADQENQDSEEHYAKLESYKSPKAYLESLFQQSSVQLVKDNFQVKQTIMRVVSLKGVSEIGEYRRRSSSETSLPSHSAEPQEIFRKCLELNRRASNP